MIFKTVTLLSLAVCVLGNGHAVSEQKFIKHFGGHHGELKHVGEHEPEHREEYAHAYPSYEFSYHVNDPHTHDIKGQEESRKGDEVKGEYWFIEPDGRKRTVKYTSDKHSGFKAIVEYSAPHHHIHHQEEHKEHHEGPQKEEIKEHHEEPQHHLERKHENVIVVKEVSEEKHQPQHIPSLSVHAPRYFKYEREGYFHPRDHRRYRRRQ